MSLGTSQFQFGDHIQEIWGFEVVVFLFDLPVLRGWARVGSEAPSPRSLCQMGGHIHGSTRLGLTGAGLAAFVGNLYNSYLVLSPFL